MRVSEMTAAFVMVGVTLLTAASSCMAQSRDMSVEAMMRSEPRMALVIGNDAYPSAALRTPVNDAREMARTLRDLGFTVIARENATKGTMETAILEFGRRLTAGGVGFFYYAGHGLQVRGHNYLVPIDAQIASEAETRIAAVDVDLLLEQMGEARNRVNIVILDACRNNPFERRLRGASGGLAAIDAARGTLIAYATSPGSVASDGEAAHGLYTEELLRALRVPASRSKRCSSVCGWPSPVEGRADAVGVLFAYRGLHRQRDRQRHDSCRFGRHLRSITDRRSRGIVLEIDRGRE